MAEEIEKAIRKQMLSAPAPMPTGIADEEEESDPDQK
jgi:hypothetical protein